jgi:hypothetical protein
MKTTATQEHIGRPAKPENGGLRRPKRKVDADDKLSPAEAELVRRGEQQLKRGESKPWRDTGGKVGRGPNETAILDRLVARNTPLSEEAARYFLSLSFPRSDVDRMNALAEKARRGSTTKQEMDEMQRYLHVGHLLALVQSRARLALKKLDSPSRF